MSGLCLFPSPAGESPTAVSGDQTLPLSRLFLPALLLHPSQHWWVPCSMSRTALLPTRPLVSPPQLFIVLYGGFTAVKTGTQREVTDCLNSWTTGVWSLMAEHSLPRVGMSLGPTRKFWGGGQRKCGSPVLSGRIWSGKMGMNVCKRERRTVSTEGSKDGV